MSAWRSFPLAIEEANIALILPKGQSFRWKQLSDGSWLGVAQHRVWLLRQESSSLHFRLLCGPAKPPPELILKDYFGLNSGGPRLADLYAQWSKTIVPFGPIGQQFPGVRLLRQDPLETLFAFICSSNNNIARISLMVERMCAQFGARLGVADDEEFYDFPELEVLAKEGVEQKLRELGFGYRAKFVQSTARLLLEKGGYPWLLKLRSVPYEEAASALVALPGVGRKVADCVCLSALDHAEAVPLDTHVLQLAWRHHKDRLGKIGNGPPKGLSEGSYRAISQILRETWSPKAGWAQAVLFTSDLRSSRLEQEPQKGKAKAKAFEKIAKQEKRGRKVKVEHGKTYKVTEEEAEAKKVVRIKEEAEDLLRNKEIKMEMKDEASLDQNFMKKRTSKRKNSEIISEDKRPSKAART